jgi:tetratricopeptide (TPR) repeat protein
VTGDTLKDTLPSLKIAYLSVLALLAAGFSLAMQAQTYSVEGDGKAQPATPASKEQQQLGWGSNIQNARFARAAELALRKGDHAQAVDYAQRAAQAAPNDPQLWFLLGYAARLDGKLPLSADAYSRGLRLNPSSLDGISGLAQTDSVMGRTADAERLLEQVLAANPRRRDDAMLLGDILMRSGDYNGAITWLSKAEEAQPGPRSELLLALAYQHLKQMDQASHYLELAKRRSPDSPDVQRSLAGYYREMGNYPQAIAELKSMRNAKPDVVAELAYTYELDGNEEEAATLYKQAANAEPRDLNLQLSAAQAQVAAGSIEDAKTFLDRVAVTEPNEYRLHAIRGEIAAVQDRDSEAAHEYGIAVANLPQAPIEGPLYGIQLRLQLMELDQNLGDAAAARHELELAQRAINGIDTQGPGRGQFLRIRAQIEMHAGNLDAALRDANEALSINSEDRNSLQLDGDLLMKLGRPEDAIKVYRRIIAEDPQNRLALTSLGYASRAAGRDQDAERYFERLQHAYPSLYAPYLALGDFYTARRDFSKAELNYSKGYTLAPKNPLFVAGGMNAAIEAHKLDLAATWMSRATDDMQHNPQLLREEERYLRFKGDYQRSADLGEEAIKSLPGDRDVVVYLGYDMLRLEKYDALSKLLATYGDKFPKDADLALLSGYLHKHDGQLAQAQDDFTDALSRNPDAVTAYVNRGFIETDLHRPQAAAADFESALKLEPNNGEAHLGLAYASLDLHKSQVALKQAQLAQEQMGDSQPIHLIRATAYGLQGMLAKSADEYRTALKFTPDDGGLHLALGSTLYANRQYREAIDELQTAQKLSPDNPLPYALLSRSYAELHDRDETLRYVQLAEQHAQAALAAAPGSGSAASAIYLSTGEALSTLGDQKAAMDSFARALTAPQSDRVAVRLAIAQLMAREGQSDDAGRQIALALMEAEAGETMPPTGNQLVAAADVFREMHDYDLSQKYLQRAEAAGAPETTVRIGLANNYLALGDTARAEGELASINTQPDSEPDYQYLLAKANVLSQEHQGAQALTAFAQATDAAGDDQTAEQSLLMAGANEGLRVTPNLSVLSGFSVQPIFEDTTVYVLDAKLDASFPVPSSDTALLPPPRSSVETQWTGAYHLHLGNLPSPGGFFQVRNARGEISVPSTNSIVNRDTTDYTFNFGLNPTIHVGSNALTFAGGIQETVRRDSQQPVAMNQNLLREFAYVTTSSFFDVLSVSGYVIHESGPFTESNLHSRALTAAVDFRVGAPWGKTALVTGWGSNDQLYTPTNYENYYTSSYIGLERKFSNRLTVRAIAEDLRAWRIVGKNSGIAQDLRPSGVVDFTPARNWELQASAAYSDTRSFHVYDAVQTGFSISYMRPFTRKFNDQTGEVYLKYPIRFSGGIQQQSFFNFPGGHQQFRPYISITLF